MIGSSERGQTKNLTEKPECNYINNKDKLFINSAKERKKRGRKRGIAMVLI
mgnify:CR=1 FL=1